MVVVGDNSSLRSAGLGRAVRPFTRVLFDLVLLTLFVISSFKRVNVCGVF